MNIPLSRPDIGERELAYVADVLRSGHLSLGARVPEFERRFAAFVGARYAVAVSSGTSALHLCVRALGIRPGDEVITTALSFVASTNCILYESAIPVFLDIDPTSLNLDPAQVEAFLSSCCERHGEQLIDRVTGRRVKAILPVHVFGLPCDMHAIARLARIYHLSVIEDACEALGAGYRGRHVGTFSDAATFAFYPNKQMTTAEGGMVVTHDPDIAVACQSMRNQGREEGSDWLRHVHLGFNYRLSDVHAAIGIAQLERFAELHAHRQRVAQWYREALADNPWIRLPAKEAHSDRGWFVFAVQLSEELPPGLRDRLLFALRRNGVSCQAYFPAIHHQPYLSPGQFHVPFALDATESAAARLLALPFYSSLRQDEVHHVCATLARLLQSELDATTLEQERVAS